MLFMFSREMSTWFLGGVIDNARNTKRTPPPLGGQCFSSSSSSFFVSALLHVFLPSFPFIHLFSLPVSFFLFRIESKLSKLSVSVPIFLYSLNQKLYIQRRGAQGRLGEGAFVYFLFFFEM